MFEKNNQFNNLNKIKINGGKNINRCKTIIVANITKKKMIFILNGFNS